MQSPMIGCFEAILKLHHGGDPNQSIILTQRSTNPYPGNRGTDAWPWLEDDLVGLL